MITTLIITLVATFFLGGGASIFLHPSLKKSVKKRIKEKDRQELILSEIEIGQELIESFNARLKTYNKAMQEIARNHYTSDDELQLLGQSAMAARQRTNELFVDARLRFQMLITDEEWGLVLADVGELNEKALKKKKKQLEGGREKTHDLLQKMLSDLNISKELKDKAIEINDSLISAFERLLIEQLSNNIQSHTVLTDREAEKQALISRYDQTDKIRKECFDLFCQLHHCLVSESDPKNWKKTSKALVQYF